ncbi:aldo/keto reductase [Streptomyces sp. NPDC088400]|uniref:aldo/keto reductase n=1 Tax=Streptomyces sp. NPDC088400 TaxID=3365861 RepID=UPI0037FDDD0D
MRYIGLSEASAAELEQVRETAPIVSVRNRYDITDRQSESVLDRAERLGIAWLP